ncbi:hypothetical protein DS901_00030 [Loktanella sp. D2R18]|nr:hypothetical protein DS901_00030 [Loktanella sp. D2R18]
MSFGQVAIIDVPDYQVASDFMDGETAKPAVVRMPPKSSKFCTEDIDGVFYVPIWMHVRRKSASSPKRPMLRCTLRSAIGLNFVLLNSDR